MTPLFDVTAALKTEPREFAGHGLIEAASAEGGEEIGVHVYDGSYPGAFLACRESLAAERTVSP